VYFASRTHSQLRQLTAELLKTQFPANLETAESEEGVSLVPLASRRQMCINDKVRHLKGENQMNEACLDMQKSGELEAKAQLTRRLRPMRVSPPKERRGAAS
jgi:chromosome transmission fidelity protein 1